jgi:(1->4)-alpha-D-glucan 1-alpha-D-glucosylmutase
VDSPTVHARVPVATYRLQFNARFTFRDARAIVRYLDQLGITDAYASSYLKAVPGSSHGYDVADPTRLNPEVGTEEEYWAWVQELRAHGMGHILDVVPNHMGLARSSNPWWLDVLENGASSRFAKFFDIEWQPVKAELSGKVLIPILGDQYGAALENREVQLQYADGAFTVNYYDDKLPIAPDTYGRILRPGLDVWLEAHRDELDEQDIDELQSVITASENLPSRRSTDAQAIAVRAREKEIVKRRLATVFGRSVTLQRFVDDALVRLNGRAGEPRSFDEFDDLLNEQSYRLAYWRVASEEINYRRFFDVNQLAALRVEDPEVFDEVHRFVFALVEQRAATGLRIDHVDGLFAPPDYLRRLQARAGEALGAPPGSGERPMYVVVEKILGVDEGLATHWPVHGTTGYQFAAVVNNLFVDGAGRRAMDDVYTRFVSDRRQVLSFEDLVYRSKKLILHETMSGDINSLASQIDRFSERNRHFRDFTLYSLISALKDIIACFPIYRTYVTIDEPVREHDRVAITRAMGCARSRAAGVTSVVFDFLERLLLNEVSPGTLGEREEMGRLIGKFQQLTGPVAAKGIEDTTFYVYNRLLSLNEVGSDPTTFGLPPDTVHRWMSDRQRSWPASLSATGTHDTKRGEDVRARLNVLSEIPREWKSAVTRWRALNRRFKREVQGRFAPSANEEYLIYQTLVGAWPLAPDSEAAFVERLREYLTKALREAKLNTDWLSPNEEYEAAVHAFLGAILDPRRPFLAAFRTFQARVAELGVYNSLAQLLIKITAPGVPDFYQGTELWDLSLVDPDNRRPVDYALRQRALGELLGSHEPPGALAASLLRERRDGRVKMFATARALHLRRERRDLFDRGLYEPIEVSGVRAASVFAFARRLDAEVALTCVPRLLGSLPPGTPPLGRRMWEDTRIVLPPSIGQGCFQDAFTGARVTAVPGDAGSLIDVADVFERFPIALLTPCPSAPMPPERHAWST